MISQYLCQRDLSQQVEGNMSASEAAIREHPAAIRALPVWHPFHVLDTHEPASTREKALLHQVITNHPSLMRALFICTINPKPRCLPRT